jgi:hypothetical protein
MRWHSVSKSDEYQKLNDVDSAGVDGRVFILPREVFTTTRWLSEEVSRGHITWRNEVSTNGTGLTNKEGLNAIGS